MSTLQKENEERARELLNLLEGKDKAILHDEFIKRELGVVPSPPEVKVLEEKRSLSPRTSNVEIAYHWLQEGLPKGFEKNEKINWGVTFNSLFAKKFGSTCKIDDQKVETSMQVPSEGPRIAVFKVKDIPIYELYFKRVRKDDCKKYAYWEVLKREMPIMHNIILGIMIKRKENPPSAEIMLDTDWEILPSSDYQNSLYRDIYYTVISKVKRYVKIPSHTLVKFEMFEMQDLNSFLNKNEIKGAKNRFDFWDVLRLTKVVPFSSKTINTHADNTIKTLYISSKEPERGELPLLEIEYSTLQNKDPKKQDLAALKSLEVLFPKLFKRIIDTTNFKLLVVPTKSGVSLIKKPTDQTDLPRQCDDEDGGSHRGVESECEEEVDTGEAFADAKEGQIRNEAKKYIEENVVNTDKSYLMEIFAEHFLEGKYPIPKTAEFFGDPGDICWQSGFIPSQLDWGLAQYDSNIENLLLSGGIVPYFTILYNSPSTLNLRVTLIQENSEEGDEEEKLNAEQETKEDTMIFADLSFPPSSTLSQVYRVALFETCKVFLPYLAQMIAVSSIKSALKSAQPSTSPTLTPTPSSQAPAIQTPQPSSKPEPVIKPHTPQKSTQAASATPMDTAELEKYTKLSMVDLLHTSVAKTDSFVISNLYYHNKKALALRAVLNENRSEFEKLVLSIKKNNSTLDEKFEDFVWKVFKIRTKTLLTPKKELLCCNDYSGKVYWKLELQSTNPFEDITQEWVRRLSTCTCWRLWISAEYYSQVLIPAHRNSYPT